MSFRFRLYNDINYKSVFRDVVCGECSGTLDDDSLTTWVEDGETFYYLGKTYMRNAFGESDQPLVTSNDNTGSAGAHNSTKYFPNNSNMVIAGFAYDGQSSPSTGVALRSIYVGGELKTPDINKGGDGLQLKFSIYGYTMEVRGVEMVIFSVDELSPDQSTYAATVCGISKNALEKAAPPRYGEDSEANEDGGYGTGEGGDGDGTTDAPSENAMPLGSGIHAYKINFAAYNEISSKLWGDDENIFNALWYKFVNYKFNPIAGVINCIRLPDQFAPTATGSANIRMAGIILTGTTGVPLANGGGQYKTHTFSISISKYYADFRDFSGATRCVLHLPFCGAIELSPSAVIGRTLTVIYCCDCLTGNVSARVQISAYPNGLPYQGTGNTGGYIAQGTGNCAYSVPICGNDNGMGDKLATLKTFATGISDAVAASASGGATGTGDAAAVGIGTLVDYKLARYTTSVVGSLGGGVANVSDLACRLVIERDVPSKPKDYGTLRGWMLNTSGTVGNYAGYSVFSAVNLQTGGASDEEKTEIENLLYGGVWV